MSGLIPAIPLIVIRPFLPESPSWKAERDAGTLKRPSIRELFSPELRRTTVISTLMFACAFGAAFGAIQQIPRIVPGLPQVESAVKATIAAKEEAAGTPLPITEKKRTESMVAQKTAAGVTKVQELGGLAGRLLLAVLAVAIVSRRSLVRIFQIPGMLIIPFVFVYAAVNDLTLLYYGIFIDGMLTVGQFSFWGNYLPRVYPIHLRGTGEGFAANIGGRLVGTSFAWLTSVLAVQPWVPGGDPATKLAYTAAAVAFAVYLAAFVLSFFFPEPGEGHLPE